MNDEQVKALKDFGKQLAIIYQSAIEESGSTEVAKQIVHQFIRATINQDTPKFFM